jgi:hypothetical protein
VNKIPWPKKCERQELLEEEPILLEKYVTNYFLYILNGEKLFIKFFFDIDVRWDSQVGFLRNFLKQIHPDLIWAKEITVESQSLSIENVYYFIASANQSRELC